MRLIPRETKFFDLFAQIASNLIDGARLARDLFADYRDVPNIVQKIKGVEHKGDDFTHAVFIKLSQSFITPFDREDIHLLASSFDDVLDFLYSATDRLVLYKIQNPPPACAALTTIILRQAEELKDAIILLEKNQTKLLEHCVEVNRLENEADSVSRHAIADLFENEKDPIRLIKIKELLEVLESASDRAEDAANVLETVVLKSA